MSRHCRRAGRFRSASRHRRVRSLLIAAIVAVLVECVGGILLIVGYQTRLTGIVLAAWCIATALVAHRNFGNQDQMIHFLKNVAMAGGFLQLAAFGAGGWSLDARRSTVALYRS